MTAMFSRASDAEVGSFHYPLGLVAFTLSGPAQHAMEMIRTGQRIHAEPYSHDELLRIAYEVASAFHEYRHYFDMYGTNAGYSLFEGRLSILKEFAALSLALNQIDVPWKLPLVNWPKSQDCLQPIRDFIRKAQAFEMASTVYVAPFPPLEIDGHLESLSIEVPYEVGGLVVDAFPLRIGKIGDDGVTRARSILMPLGLEALMEGNAHAVCRDIVEHYFPPEIAQQLAPLQATFTIDDGDHEDQAAARWTTSYMVTDRLVSRYFREHGTMQFPRDLVLALTDFVLMRGWIQSIEVQPGTIGVHADRLGNQFVTKLQAMDPNKLANCFLPDQVEIDQAYGGLLASLEQHGDWDAIDDDGSALASLNIWEAYVAKHCVVPLLTQRKASANDAFRSVGGFLKAIGKVESAPVRVANGKLLLEMPGRVQVAWWHQLMLGEILRQLINGEPVIHCPRARGFFPGINTANLAFDADCERHLILGCGSFEASQAAYSPNCLFESALHNFSLRRM